MCVLWSWNPPLVDIFSNEIGGVMLAGLFRGILWSFLLDVLQHRFRLEHVSWCLKGRYTFLLMDNDFLVVRMVKGLQLYNNIGISTGTSVRSARVENQSTVFEKIFLI